ncbi:hypothetical protein ElyMa_006113500 [Elysia marginata]|uniref:Uncharacterized protein n=1 Tax=Elysia marginata TaxID=1093978 RepID=A0AAV4GV81_9GAST|nr:hypothetical protein ElyMa_006113500 [Elysia marginata]
MPAAGEPLPVTAMDSINYYFKPDVMRKDGMVSYLLHTLGMFQTRLWSVTSKSRDRYHHCVEFDKLQQQL